MTDIASRMQHHYSIHHTLASIILYTLESQIQHTLASIILYTLESQIQHTLASIILYTLESQIQDTLASQISSHGTLWKAIKRHQVYLSFRCCT